MTKESTVFDMICATINPDPYTNLHYFLVLNSEGLVEEITKKSKARKSELNDVFRKAAEEVGAVDVFVTWSRKSGLQFEGFIFAERPHAPKGMSRTKVIRMYNGHKNVLVAEPKPGVDSKFTQKLAWLRENYSGPVETHDFYMEYFDFDYQAVGRVKQGSSNVMVPPFFHNTAFGLIIQMPRDRLYDQPEGSVMLPQSAYAYAREFTTQEKTGKQG